MPFTQGLWQGRPERAGARSHGNALLDQESPDLIDGCRTPRDQARADAMASLEIEFSGDFSFTSLRFGRRAASAMASASL
jgi:hypothetical protein